jgi:hypothetical protein
MLTGINQLARTAASWHFCMLRLRRLLHGRLVLSSAIALHLGGAMCVLKQPQLCVLLSLCSCAHSTAHATVRLYADQRPRSFNVSLAHRHRDVFPLTIQMAYIKRVYEHMLRIACIQRPIATIAMRTAVATKSGFNCESVHRWTH